MITLSEYQLAELLTTANRLGAMKFAAETGLLKKAVTRAEAYRMYSRRLVDGWIRDSKIKPAKINNLVLLDAVELEILSKTNQLANKIAAL